MFSTSQLNRFMCLVNEKSSIWDSELKRILLLIRFTEIIWSQNKLLAQLAQWNRDPHIMCLWIICKNLLSSSLQHGWMQKNFALWNVSLFFIGSSSCFQQVKYKNHLLLMINCQFETPSQNGLYYQLALST